MGTVSGTGHRLKRWKDVPVAGQIEQKKNVTWIFLNYVPILTVPQIVPNSKTMHTDFFDNAQWRPYPSGGKKWREKLS